MNSCLIELLVYIGVLIFSFHLLSTGIQIGLASSIPSRRPHTSVEYPLHPISRESHSTLGSSTRLEEQLLLSSILLPSPLVRWYHHSASEPIMSIKVQVAGPITRCNALCTKTCSTINHYSNTTDNTKKICGVKYKKEKIARTHKGKRSVSSYSSNYTCRTLYFLQHIALNFVYTTVFKICIIY